MTTAGKIITLLVFGAIFLAAITHAAGFSAVALSSGNVLDNTLSVESGAGRTGGTTGSVNLGNGQQFTLA